MHTTLFRKYEKEKQTDKQTNKLLLLLNTDNNINQKRKAINSLEL